MTNEESGSQVKTDGGGAAAAGGSVAAGAKGIAARGNVTIKNYKITQVRGYINDKGPGAYKGMGDPDQAWILDLDSTVDVEDLREKLLNDPAKREELKKQPRTVSVKGLLYPCALLVSGWWESKIQEIQGIKWHNGVQEWLFSGFHSWGPSWDFTWDFEHPANDADKPSFIAQLGNGDEANSIPVIIPVDKAKKLQEKFQEKGHELGMSAAGLSATVTGVLCHRSHCPEAARLGLVGGILDFCIWLKPGEEAHKISPDRSRPDIYSAYLWRCVAPEDWVKEGTALELNQVYFIWEHTNLVDESSIKYNLDSMERKEAYIRSKFHDNGKLVLLQKSSLLVPGEPKWSKQEFYNFFHQKDEDI